MVKQGHYAKASRKKVVRQFKQHHAAHEDQAIDDRKVKDYLLVRYHLTQSKHQRAVIQKTMQQFFGQWLDFATTNDEWDVAALTKRTLQLTNWQLPWQYYAVLDQQFVTWQAFLVKEAPAVPLTTRLRVKNTLTPAAWQQLLTQQLAINGLLGSLGGDAQKLPQLTTAQIEQLQTSLQTGDQVNWAQVAALCGPIKIDMAAFDQGMQGLLRRLAKLTAADFGKD